MNERMDADEKDLSSQSVSQSVSQSASQPVSQSVSQSVNKTPLKANFFERILSVKNEGNYKYISVFGKKIISFNIAKREKRKRERKEKKLSKLFLDPKKTNIYRNIKLIEFLITMRCNYKCEYCSQRGSDKSESASNEVIDNFLMMIPQIPVGAKIKIIGGEPIVHPRFFEVAANILKNGHILSVGTNFSYPNTYFEKLLDEIADGEKNRLLIMTSLHLSQVKSIDWFIDKVLQLKKYGADKLNISVSSCLTQENFEIIKNIRERFVVNGIYFVFQRLITNRSRAIYSQEIEDFLKSCNNFKVHNNMTEMNKNTYGLECSAGYAFVKINVNGNVHRCFEHQKNIFDLGNLQDGKINIFTKPLPCLSNKCVCAFPLANRLVDPNNKRDIPLANKIKSL